MYIRIIISAVVAILLVSCSKSSNTQASFHNDHTVFIDLKDAPTRRWSEFLDNITIVGLVPLKTDNPLDEVRNIKNADGYLYISDKSKKLYSFDMSGQARFVINAHGRGRGEYIDLTDFCIHNDTIFILDRLTSRILCYSSKTGKYQSYIKIENTADYFGIAATDDGIYLLKSMFNYPFKQNSYPLELINYSGKTQSNLLQQSEWYIKQTEEYYWGGECCIYRLGDQTHLAIPFRNAIYEIASSDSAYIKYRFDFGQNDIDSHIDSPSAMSPANRSLTAFDGGVVAETNEHIILYTTSEQAMSYLVYNKRSSRYDIFTHQINGTYCLMGGDSYVYSINDSCFATLISPYKITPLPHQITLEGFSDNIKSVYDELHSRDISSDDNPILMLFDIPF